MNTINKTSITIHKNDNWKEYGIDLRKSIYPTKDKIRKTEEQFIDRGVSLVKSYAESGMSLEDCKRDLIKAGHSEEYCDSVINKAYCESTPLESMEFEQKEEKSTNTESKKNSIMIKGKYFTKK